MIQAPKNEILWLQLANNGKTTHVITSTIIRDTYYLYKVSEDGKLTRTGHKSSNPTDLEKYAYEEKEYEDADYEF